MLLRLIYVSRSLTPMPPDLSQILASSRKNNPPLGINGALCFLDGVYFQYLEGESNNVTELYHKIKSDPRHKDSKILDFERISERGYPKWSMALLTWNDETKAIFNRYNPDCGFDAYATDPTSAATMLLEWSKTSNWMTL